MYIIRIDFTAYGTESISTNGQFIITFKSVCPEGQKDYTFQLSTSLKYNYPTTVITVYDMNDSPVYTLEKSFYLVTDPYIENACIPSTKVRINITITGYGDLLFRLLLNSNVIYRLDSEAGKNNEVILNLSTDLPSFNYGVDGDILNIMTNKEYNICPNAKTSIDSYKLQSDTLPNGLTFSEATGCISGIISDIFSYKYNQLLYNILF